MKLLGSGDSKENSHSMPWQSEVQKPKLKINLAWK